MVMRTKDLPEFVAQSDRLGGPGTPACDRYWSGLEYRPDTIVDQALDPFGEAYVAQQLALYHEMSGRDFDQTSNEHTSLNVEAHAAAINPYDHGFPGGLALHIERLSRAIRFGAPPRGSKFLDMGCGWGLSSEIAAYCGVDVTAVDVNPDFVDLVNRRASRLGHRITAQIGTFDAFESDDRFAMILFYECFHHALRPWTVLARMARHLVPGGKVVLAGEPINNNWKHWGLRQDVLSVYCIHKFGWLESGWSAEFLLAVFERTGLSVEIIGDLAGEPGPVVVGTRASTERLGANDIATRWKHAGWFVDAGYMTSGATSRLDVPTPPGVGTALLGFHNFRAQSVSVSIAGDGIAIARDMPPGRTEIEIGIGIGADRLVTKLLISAETWVPDQEVGNGDRRKIGIHLEDVSFF